jgi:hypothetical protein
MAENALVRLLVKKYPALRPIVGWISAISLASATVAGFLGHIEKIKQFLFEWIGPDRLRSLHFGMAAFVSILFALGYATACFWLYKRWVRSRGSRARRIGVALALSAGFVGITWFTARSVIPAPPDMNALLKTESERWRKELLELQNKPDNTKDYDATNNGGFRFSLTEASDSQAWTSGQILVGILAGKPGLTHEDTTVIRSAFAFFEKTKLAEEGEGWGYFAYVPWGVTEINAWVAIAYAYSLAPGNAERVWGPNREAASTHLDAVLRLIAQRQERNRGGWAPINETANTRFARTYSTVMSLWALLEARRLGTRYRQFDRNISAGIKWMLENYNAQTSGWVPNPDREKQLDSFPGLTAQVLYVLTLARPDFDYLITGSHYEEGLSLFSKWLEGDVPPKQTEGFYTRRLSNNDQMHDSDRYLPRSKFFIEASSYLWYPWTFALCVVLQDSQPGKWSSCSGIYGRVHELIKFAREQPFTYVMAEGLFAINLYLVWRDPAKGR